MKFYFFLLILSLTFSNSISGQFDVSKYKKISDKYVETKFSKSLKNKCLFESFYTTTFDSGYSHFSPNEIINNTIDSFISLTFKYSFFSKKLNYKMEFELTINKDSTIENSVDIFRYIPSCIISDSICNLLTKDQAIQLAKKFKIKYAVSFDIEFCKPSDKSDYYWHIVGFDKKYIRKPNQRNNYRFSGGQLRIINARTGELISWENYLKQ